jgi:hypothetical protein
MSTSNWEQNFYRWYCAVSLLGAAARIQRNLFYTVKIFYHRHHLTGKEQVFLLSKTPVSNFTVPQVTTEANSF